MFSKTTWLSEKKMVGFSSTMSLKENKTPELWKRFMTSRKNVNHTIGSDLYSIQIYNPSLNFHDFNPATAFDKWAAVEVSDFIHLPKGMASLIIPEGKYAVFIHRGHPASITNTFQYIFNTWLPASAHILDQRPHFEVLGEKYSNDQSSEEEVWIPITDK